MFELFLAIMLAFASPSHHASTNCHNTTVTTQGNPSDTGGEGEHVPPGHKP